MTKPIIVVKVPCKLLYVIQVKEFLIKCSTSWPYLISEFLVAYITIVASDWPRTFLHPRCFCLALNLHAAVSAAHYAMCIIYTEGSASTVNGSHVWTSSHHWITWAASYR